MADKRSTFGFRLAPEDVGAPTLDPAYAHVPAGRKAFWKQAARVAQDAWEDARAQGLDRWGRPMAPISANTRAARKRPGYSPMGQASPDAPPLQAAGGRSRTQSDFRGVPGEHGVWFQWSYDPHTGHDWGEILAFHRTGGFRTLGGKPVYIPSRDVFGFSRGELKAIAEAMAAWWARARGRYAALGATIARGGGNPRRPPNERTYVMPGALTGHSVTPGRTPPVGQVGGLFQYRGRTTLGPPRIPGPPKPPPPVVPPPKPPPVVPPPVVPPPKPPPVVPPPKPPPLGLPKPVPRPALPPPVAPPPAPAPAPEPKPRKPRAPKATKPPAGPIPPGPIQERLAAYTEGDRKIAAIVKIQADLIERQAAINVLTNEFCALEATLPGYRDRTDEQWAQLRAISDKVDALAKALDPLRKSAERRIAAVLAVPKAMRLITKNTSMAELRRDQRKAAKDGVDWLHKATAADAEVGTDGKPLWTVWHQIDRKREQRAYHSGRTLTLDGREERMSIIALSNRSPRRTAIHELGHALEHQLPTVNARAVEFAAYRIGDEPFSKMALLFPGHGYGEHEQGRKDKFDQAFDRNSAYYIGKSYAGNSEVVSMGIEKLSVDPVGFAKNDPEFCKFILGILDGALR